MLRGIPARSPSADPPRARRAAISLERDPHQDGDREGFKLSFNSRITDPIAVDDDAGGRAGLFEDAQHLFEVVPAKGRGLCDQ